MRIEILSLEIPIYYLYVRSFYNRAIISKKGYDYYIELAKSQWRDRTLYEQALIALTLNMKLAAERVSLERF